MKKGFLLITFIFSTTICLASILYANPALDADRDYNWENERCHLIRNNGEKGPIVKSFQAAIALCPMTQELEKIKTFYTKLQDITWCSEIVLSESEIGTTCMTEKGGRFQRYQNPITQELGILDLSENGKVWYDKIYVNKRYAKALKACPENQELPSIEDFEKAEYWGFREAFSYDMDGEFFWSKTENPGNHRYALDFNGSNGSTENGYHGYKAIYQYSRCIGPPN